jgi:hypothetical protein
MFGVMARDAAVAVLVRRGPSNWFQMILWRTDRDEVVRGQWVKHRVHDWGYDVSPDGALFVYYARGGGRKYEQWTGVSRPPYFSCLALWSVTGPGGGGGMFVGRRELVVLGLSGKRKREEREPIPLKVLAAHTLTEWAAMPTLRAMGGWAEAGEGQWEKVAERKRWVVRREEAEPAGASWKWKYAVVDGEQVFELEGADWADVDQAGRLVFTCAGRLYAGAVSREGVAWKELADFSGDRPEPAAAPAWAMKWP